MTPSWRIHEDLCARISRAMLSNYISRYLWDIIISCPCLWYLLLAHKSSYNSQRNSAKFAQYIPIIMHTDRGLLCLLWFGIRYFTHLFQHNLTGTGVTTQLLYNMMTSSNGNIPALLCAGNSPVTDEFTPQRPVTRSFGVFFDLRPNKRLSKQSCGWWFKTQSRPLWRHCNDRRGKLGRYHTNRIRIITHNKDKAQQHSVHKLGDNISPGT